MPVLVRMGLALGLLDRASCLEEWSCGCVLILDILHRGSEEELRTRAVSSSRSSGTAYSLHLKQKSQ